MQSIQTLNALSHAIANFPIINECGCLGTASWFVFKTLMHTCYFCMMHPGVILEILVYVYFILDIFIFFIYILIYYIYFCFCIQHIIIIYNTLE